MDLDALDARLRGYTNNEVSHWDALTGYAQILRRAADAIDVALARVDVTTDGLRVWLAEVPDLVIGWNAIVGWWFTAHDTVVYKAGAETDPAGLAPDPDTVAAWLAVLRDGDRSGHDEPPAPPSADDAALLHQLERHARESSLPT